MFKCRMRVVAPCHGLSWLFFAGKAVKNSGRVLLVERPLERFLMFNAQTQCSMLQENRLFFFASYRAGEANQTALEALKPFNFKLIACSTGSTSIVCRELPAEIRIFS